MPDWCLEDGLLRVRAEGAPEAEVRRAGPRRRRDVPIGTREPERLELRVDGDRVALLPRPGAFSRRSYAVRAAGGPVDLQLTPSSGARSHRVRWTRAGHFLGELELVDDDVLLADWTALDPDVPASLRRRVPVRSPAEVVTGHALAAAFGTGARLRLPAVLSRLVESAEPPGL